MTYKFPIEYGHILTFARAVGDLNRAYVDADFDGGVIAPPTFAVASSQFDPDFRLRPRPGEPWVGSGRTPSGVDTATTSNGRILHGEQHFEYHQPVRPGQHLTASARNGEVTHKQGRNGPMTFRELITEYRDEAGELIVTSRAVIVELGEAK